MEVVIQDVNTLELQYNDFSCVADGIAPTGADLFKKNVQISGAGLFQIWVTMFNKSTLDTLVFFSNSLLGDETVVSSSLLTMCFNEYPERPILVSPAVYFTSEVYTNKFLE